MLRVVGLITAVLIVTILYACCMAAATSDEQAERMFQEYLEHKKEKEARNKHG